MKKQIENIQIAFSGTLGDAFIVLCKLYGRHKKTNEQYELIRYSQHPNMDGFIKSLFKTVSFVEYKTPCKVVKSKNDLQDKLSQLSFDYLNVSWDGTDHGTAKSDPAGFDLDPYPRLAVPKIDLNRKSFKIGIQLHSGKIHGNFKGFSMKWISDLRKWLSKEKFEIYLFGTGDGYSLSKVEQLCKKQRIKCLAGKTDFMEWLSYIKSMDFFITPEGFSAFFAMSQRVRSLVFYTDYQILGRVHPDWQRENIIMSAGQENILGRILNRISRTAVKRNRLFAPLKPAQVRSLIHGEVAYK